jgi:two-component system, cell cycle response regulator
MRTEALWKAKGNALPSEMVSLSERLSLMLMVRTAIVAVTLTSGLFGVPLESGGMKTLVALSGVYLAISLAAEGARRVGGGRGLVVVSALLLVDGLYLAWVTYTTGGAHSPLRFLLYGHLIAVTLLASYRTGLKIALWDSLLVFVSFYAQLAGFLPPVEVSKGTTEFAQSPFHRIVIYNLIGFWLVAVGTAIFSGFNERTLRKRGLDLEALATMAAEMDKVSDTKHAAQCLVQVASDTFKFERIAVMVMRDGRLSVAAEEGCGPLPESNLMGDQALDQLKATRRTVLLTAVDSRTDPSLGSMFPGAKRLVIVPLLVEGALVGALMAESSKKRRYRLEASTLTVVEQFATQAALAFSNVWLLEKVQKLADTDSLTGIYNRMVFDRTLRAEIKRADRNGESMSLLMLDIDHFKSLNDRFGHQTGDEVLRTLAGALGEESRDFDTVTRYGGEEFAVLLPNTDRAAGAIAGERFRKLVESLEGPVPITASVGVATFPGNAQSADGLLSAADDALYESKRTGRNRVVVSDKVPIREKAAG